MRGVGERVSAGDAELVEVDVVQEHIDAAEVVGGGVYLLAEEALPDPVDPQYLCELEKQRARAARRVIHLVDARLAADDYAGQKLGDLLRREELSAGLAGVGGVHVHEVLVSVAKEVNVGVCYAAKVEVTDTGDDLCQAVLPLGQAAAQFVGGDVNVVKEALEVLLGGQAHGRALDGLEDLRHMDVKVLVLLRSLCHVLEELGRQDEVALLLCGALARPLCVIVREGRVREVWVSGLVLARVNVLGEVLRDEAAEEEAEDVGLEVPAVHRAAHLVRDSPDCLVELSPLGFPVFRRGHCGAFLLCAGAVANETIALLVTVAADRTTIGRGGGKQRAWLAA